MPDRCGATIPPWATPLAHSPRARPAGHHGGWRPAPLTTDEEDE